MSYGPHSPPNVPYPSATEARRSGRPLIAGMIAVLILIFTLIFSFPYLLADDWAFGVMIAAIGLCIVAVILYVGGKRELEFDRRHGQGSPFDRKNMLIGFFILITGIMMIVLGGPLSSVAIISAYIVGTGVLLVFAGIFWIMLAIRG